MPGELPQLESAAANGRVSLLAKAIGEESFVDANGNGAFDNGETFTDLPEPFRDDDEDTVYDSGEDFFDFNNNQLRDPLDAIFNGVLCNDNTGRCGGPATRSTGIAEQNRIILSGSTPTVTLSGGAALPASIVLANNSAQAVSFWVDDVNSNVMPGGTTVALTATGAGLRVSQPSSFTVPCSAVASGVEFPGITLFTFNVTSGYYGRHRRDYPHDNDSAGDRDDHSNPGDGRLTQTSHLALLRPPSGGRFVSVCWLAACRPSTTSI